MQCAILSALSNPKFDMIAGTSIGSIVGGCYAAGIKADEITNFFTMSAPKIFMPTWSALLGLPRLWRSAKYKPDALREALQTIVGDLTLADVKTPFIATAFEMKTGRAVYFQSYGRTETDENEMVIGPDSNMPLVDVMIASSAAQSYFPGHQWEAYSFWDGGSTGFNAPDMLALTEAEQFSPLAEIEMLSLGNGNTMWPYAGRNMGNPGIATVAAATFDIAYSGPENSMVWLAEHRIGSRHHRLDPDIPDYAIDDARPLSLATMQGAARAALADRPDIAASFG